MTLKSRVVHGIRYQQISSLKKNEIGMEKQKSAYRVSLLVQGEPNPGQKFFLRSVYALFCFCFGFWLFRICPFVWFVLLWTVLFNDVNIRRGDTEEAQRMDA